MSSYKQASDVYLAMAIESAEQGDHEAARTYAAISQAASARAQALLAYAERVGKANSELGFSATSLAHDLLSKDGSIASLEERLGYTS